MKNIDYVIQRTASELGLDPAKVKAVVNEYWKTATDRLTKLDSTTVSIRHVGNFTISKYKLNNYIRKRIYKIRYAKTTDKYDEQKRADVLEFHYKKLKKALVQRDILAKHYQKIFKQDEQSKGLVESSESRD